MLDAPSDDLVIVSHERAVHALDGKAIDQILGDARTYGDWLDRFIDDEMLLTLYDIVRMGPTTMNSQPMRLVFIKSPEAKALLMPCLAPGNVPKVAAAPVSVIIGYDLKFFDHLPRLFPIRDARAIYEDAPARAEEDAFRNSSLQGAYLMIVARALGLDCGPMSGFDRTKVDAAFFSNTNIRSNFLCNLGYGDRTKLFPRLPRLSFKESCSIM
ncbi:malonic semialdehyde reductase [Agrobacterium sp. 13-626]|nr:malonic semialdehyde reductase [Agrobacterium sp. 13-626]